MKNSKDHWSFYNLAGRAPLSVDEVVYWKNALKKILKIGMEFEFNLPDKKNGNCKGDSKTCPCINLAAKNECWKKCVFEKDCKEFPRSREVCENASKDCEGTNCNDCANFKMHCAGIYCSRFISKCFDCKEYTMDCEKCVFRYDPDKNPELIRQNLKNVLKPNNTYGQVSSTGVHSIVTDGSLLGKKGAEIITVGRRVDYWEFYKMADKIIKEASSRGAYLNERCSFHMHALASYYGKVVDDQERYSIPNRVTELERNLPEVVLANLHQLVRRYQNAMTWMMMGLNEKDRLTRWEKFRVSVIPISAVLNDMQQVKSEVSNTAGGNKYGWINYNMVEFARDGNVSRFHVEFRACDGLMSPSAVAALGCMYYALVIKAIEISRYGIVEIGNQSWLKQAEEVKETLLNNMKGYQDGDRFGDTSKLYKHYDVLISESLDIVRQLKSILIGIGPAYEVLEKLAERPCALRRCDGHEWDRIEKDLSVIVTKEDQIDIALSEIMTLNQVSECMSEDEWIHTVGEMLYAMPELKMGEDHEEIEGRIKTFINKKYENGELLWSNSIGAPIML